MENKSDVTQHFTVSELPEGKVQKRFILGAFRFLPLGKPLTKRFKYEWNTSILASGNKALPQGGSAKLFLVIFFTATTYISDSGGDLRNIMGLSLEQQPATWGSVVRNYRLVPKQYWRYFRLQYGPIPYVCENTRWPLRGLLFMCSMQL